MARYYPNEAEFRRLAGEASVVPVHREILADALTPVVAAATVAQSPGGYLLESVVGGEKWARYSFVGFEPALIVRGVADRFERERDGMVETEEGVEPWDCLRAELAQWRPPEVPWLPRFWGGAVGYVGYDAVRRFEPKVGALEFGPDEYEFSFGIGGTVLIFDNVRHTLRVVHAARVDDDPGAAYEAAIARIDEAIVRLASPASLADLEPPDLEAKIELPASNFDRPGFRAAVERVQEHIRAGDIFQAVLSQRFRVPATDVDPFDVYRAMRVVNPSPYMYFLRHREVTIAGASPETLVRVEDGVAAVRPIAGTRRRGSTPAEDQAIEEELLADPKERAEHVMLVDLGRNDIGRISESGSVELTDRMLVERYSHVMHIVSNVTGRLAPGIDALDVLRATFPAGTLSGAPKVRAMQIIEELEPEHRGIYGGAVGYLGFGGSLDVAIAIRTVVARDGELWLQAGAGLVEASEADLEYDETVDKARAGLVAIEAARRGRDRL